MAGHHQGKKPGSLQEGDMPVSKRMGPVVGCVIR